MVSKLSTNNINSIPTSVVDRELEEVIQRRLSSSKSKVVVIGSGITSSHLGDERNLREFLTANSVANFLREKGKNAIFLLFDDSYDPLDFRQLRVAVNKDKKLIKKFEKYCGMPIKLIPDPFDCHTNYSSHYQAEILQRFYNLDMFPNIIDSYSSYESGLYDGAKEILFTKYKEIDQFLKKEFPKYTMKKMFCPVCPSCLMMEGVEVRSVKRGKVTIVCSKCSNKITENWQNVRGKFSWKIDAAVKWNVFKTDFEAFSKAYLDPDVGSYFIAKKLSEKFFGGYFPEIIHYGQVIMDKSLSYKLLESLPKEIFKTIFLSHRKKDLILSEEKILQFAAGYKVERNLSYRDYVASKLSYDLFESLNGKKLHPKYQKYMEHGIKFAKNFLKKEFHPQLPEKKLVQKTKRRMLFQIKKLFEWIILYKFENIDASMEDFSKDLDTFLLSNKMSKIKMFPIIRKILSQEHSLPMGRIFYFIQNTFLYGCLLTITQVLGERRQKRKFVQSKKLSRNFGIISPAII